MMKQIKVTLGEWEREDSAQSRWRIPELLDITELSFTFQQGLKDKEQFLTNSCNSSSALPPLETMRLPLLFLNHGISFALSLNSAAPSPSGTVSKAFLACSIISDTVTWWKSPYPTFQGSWNQLEFGIEMYPTMWHKIWRHQQNANPFNCTILKLQTSKWKNKTVCTIKFLWKVGL